MHHGLFARIAHLGIKMRFTSLQPARRRFEAAGAVLRERLDVGKSQVFVLTIETTICQLLNERKFTRAFGDTRYSARMFLIAVMAS